MSIQQRLLNERTQHFKLKNLWHKKLNLNPDEMSCEATLHENFEEKI